VKPGKRIGPLHVRPEGDMALRYAEASGDHSSVHLNEDLARSVGLPGVVLHGLYSIALVARTANEAVGGDPRSLLSLTVRGRALVEPEARQEGRRTIRNARAELDLSFADGGPQGGVGLGARFGRLTVEAVLVGCPTFRESRG
jgi:hypothetical protein